LTVLFGRILAVLAVSLLVAAAMLQAVIDVDRRWGPSIAVEQRVTGADKASSKIIFYSRDVQGVGAEG
jgi:hypothetical protein